jgi:LTXXQ motif family protein
MQRMIKVALLAAGLATGPSAAAILGTTSLTSSTAPKSRSIDMPFVSGRGVAAAVAEADGAESGVPIELTEAMDRPWEPFIGDPGRVPAQFGPPPAPRPGLLGLAPPDGPPPQPRVACEEDVDRLMGLAGYLKSKMRLREDQKAAWQKIEQIAAPGVEKIRNLCERLPSQPMPQPGLLEHIDFAEMQMAARLELLRAIHEPLHALYETLSSDQRALLIAGPRLFHPMALSPPDPRR